MTSIAHLSSKRMQNTAAGFDDLPAEIILQIIYLIPDLNTLSTIILASPSASHLFESYGVKIFNKILTSGHTHGHIVVLICIITLIRASTLPITNLKEFQEKVTYAMLRTRIASLRIHLSPRKVKRNTPVLVLRGILATERHLHDLALEFLRVHLGRFKAKRPRKLKDGSDNKFRIWRPTVSQLPWDDMEEYEYHDIGPPTRAEEQRAVRIFWRLQLLYDMKIAVKRNTLRGWSRDGRAKIREMNLMNFYGAVWSIRAPTAWDHNTIDAEYYEYLTLQKYMEEFYHFPKDDCKFLLDDLSFLKPPYSTTSVLTGRIWPVPETPASQFQEWKKGCTPLELVGNAYGTGYWWYELCQATGSHDMKYDEFRKIGMALWCKKRLVGYGLAHGTRSEKLERESRSGIWHAWVSLLRRDDSKGILLLDASGMLRWYI